MAGRGDRSRREFEQFVAECGDALLRTAYLVVWDLAEAEDLVQECLAMTPPERIKERTS
jgi:DNA-directed RNA polymerase specialized sigma24 family protein